MPGTRVRRIARVDIGQDARIGVIRRPKQSRIAIVSKAARELLIENLNEAAGRCTPSVVPVAEVRPRDSLQVRHHECCRNSFAAHVRAKDPNSLLTEIKKVEEIAADRSCSQRAGCHGGPMQHWHHAWVQIFLNSTRHLKFAFDPECRSLLLVKPFQGDRHLVEVAD